MAGFTTVRNLGLDGQDRPGSCSTSTWPAPSTRAGSPGPRIIPAGHAITPTGGHLDPTMFQRLAPGIMPQSVEEGIANGVPEVRKAVRYQIKYGARVIKISASGGVMSLQHGGRGAAVLRRGAGRHRRRGAPGRHPGGRPRPRRRRHPGLHPGRGRLHRARLAGQRRHHPADGRARHLPGRHLPPLADHMAMDRIHPVLQKKAAEIFPQARQMLGKAIEAGVKIACGTDAPAIPHGDNAKELWAMVDRGMTPMQALRAATVTSAELIERRTTSAGSRPGYLADIIAVPGRPVRGHHGRPRTSAS